MPIHFLSVDLVMQIHDDQISMFGGMNGIRDKNLLESAIYEPQATFGKRYLHKSIFDKAAAYAYGIIKNHPFIDGNKRTGMVVAINFLVLNGYVLELSQEEFYGLAMAIAMSKITRIQVSHYLKSKQ